MHASGRTARLRAAAGLLESPVQRLTSRRYPAIGGRVRPPVRPLLPAATLLLLVAPGVVLQSVGMLWRVLLGWLLGTAVGAYLGVAGSIRIRAAFAAS